jgi:hypothetical protein
MGESDEEGLLEKIDAREDDPVIQPVEVLEKPDA